MLAPFDPVRGSLMHYPMTQWRAGERVEPEWREVDDFIEAHLHLQGMERGRSAARFVWEDARKALRTYPMFMTDMVDLVRDCDDIRAGGVDGRWAVVKRGKNYGVRYAGRVEG